ncbi:polysaccharide biosynthesis/export family protein [Pseudomonas sp. NPDC078700]|uniref:polysaccharide biosynthesis/export family protein n=1 Tax=Pseudomonas sp. NPDC078700 TaxID=3364424 RepID=UPI0037CACB48
MTYRSVLALVALVFCQLVFAEGDGQYQLASGDVVRITVFGEADLSFNEIRLNDAGTFSYPFIGQVRARGKTPSQIEDLIASKLKDGYLVDPRVTVSVITYREFYISGEVKKPGGYPYQPGLTLERAIALAGGLTERASTNRVTIMRGNGTARKAQKAELETEIIPGDSITIKQGFF